MTDLKLTLLGPFRVSRHDSQVTNFESNKVRALLAYLVVEADRPHARRTLAGIFWPDRPESNALSNLRYALSDLRRTIGDREADPPYLLISRRTIQFNVASRCWCDVNAFSSVAADPASSAQQMEAALDLYRGDLLDGLSVGDSPAFDEWSLIQRERLQRGALFMLDRLVVHYQSQGDYEQALRHAWRQVELAPWQESAQRTLMRLLALSGQRGAALTQYATCCEVLEAELGVSPAVETVALFEQIRDGEQLDGATPRVLPLNDGAPRQLADPGTVRDQTRWRPLVAVLVLLALIIAVIFGLNGRKPAVLKADTQPARKVLSNCEVPSPARICILDWTSGRLLHQLDDLPFEVIDPPLSWSPDGTRIAFSAGDALRHDVVARHKLYLVDEDGANMEQVTTGLTNDMSPVWSPDGSTIAFHRNASLWILSLDGAVTTPLYEPPVGWITNGYAWSPDSQRLAFMQSRGTDGSQIHELWTIEVASAKTTRLHRFTSPFNAGTLGWGPDGEQVLVVCERERSETALLFHAHREGDGVELDQIPWGWFTFQWPQWSGE